MLRYVCERFYQAVPARLWVMPMVVWGLVAAVGAPLAADPVAPAAKATHFEPQIGTYGGERVVVTMSLPNTFNAYLTFETASTDLIEQMYRGLIAIDAISTEVVPSLAESWHIGADRKTYTFKLREGLKWSDGKPLTAEDVVFTYNQIINNTHIPNNSRDSLLIEDAFPLVTQVDRLTVKMVTPKPFVPFLQNLKHPIMPKHIFAGTTEPVNGQVPYNNMWGRSDDISQIVVNGPWKLKEYLAGQHLVLEPNPHFYLKDKAGNQLPYLERFIIKASHSNQSDLKRFESGEIDAISLRAEDHTTLNVETLADQITVKNLGPATGTLFVMFNLSTAKNEGGQPVLDPIKSKWFRNLRFRQALAHAVDKERMIKEIYAGHAIPQHSHISQQNPFYHAGVKQYPYDLKKAADLLVQAGFSKRDGQLYDADGHPVVFNLVTNQGNTLREAACRILKADWEALGIQIDYATVPFNLMLHQIDQRLDWEAMMLGLTGSSLDPHGGINSWRLDGRMHMFNKGHPAKWQEGEGTHFEPWEHELLALYEQAAQEFDVAKRQALYFKAQEIVAEYLPYLYTVNALSMVAYRNELGNIAPSIHGGSGLNQVNWNTEYHYIIKE